ncbi:TSSK2-like protein [Mya arenaria]|uniref:TSSK2-like protein n=1 Tax=Mya arenaria TaxID=6604 RepID=A0ABY7FD68_MYAAR|nr:TSSK2-like protein [Mya arenaria]WAR23679.1 TSSK2-like protein [Mya arenaria]
MSGKDTVVISDEESELKKRGYALGTTLGEGSYAKVKSAFSEKLQLRVAIKIINRKKVPRDFREKFLPRELKIFAAVEHKNVIKMYELMEFHNKHAGHGDLLEYIKLRGAIPDERAKQMFRQVASAISYLHNISIVHSKTFCGSAAYAAPEILQGKPYNMPLHDVCGSMPYDDSNIKKMVKDQTEKKVAFSKHKKVSEECQSLVNAILEVNCKKRLPMSLILTHKWLEMPTCSNEQR